jgi:hypothetical protein
MGVFAISHLGAQFQRDRATTILRAPNWLVVCQVVLAEQHPCFFGPPHPCDGRTFNRNLKREKFLREKCPDFWRRDYRDSWPPDQGWLARMEERVSPYVAMCYAATANNFSPPMEK